MPRPQEYETYLQSDRWRLVRDTQLQRDRYACRNCHSRTHLQVHHWYYQHDGVSILGKETPDDLVTLCDKCHMALTQRRQQVFGTGPSDTLIGIPMWAIWAIVIPCALGLLLWLTR